MGRFKGSGLTKRGEIWHMEKQFRGTRIRGSSDTSDLTEAQEQLAKRINDLRTARAFGTRPDHTFRAAATKFLKENQHKKSISDDAMHLKALDRFIGDLPLPLLGGRRGAVGEREIAQPDGQVST